jgi:hypothetical protein
MPIEIKELNIKINMEERPPARVENQMSEINIKKLKSELIRACTKNVIDYIKQKQER